MLVRKVRNEMNHTQREKLTNDLCGVALMLFFVEIAYQIVNSSYTEFNFNLNNVTTWCYICGGIILLIAIGLLIYAYLKKNGSKACYGIELMFFAFTLALLPGCYLYFSRPYTELRKVFTWVFFAYYIGKAAYVIIHRNDVVNSHSSNAKKKKE